MRLKAALDGAIGGTARGMLYGLLFIAALVAMALWLVAQA